MNPYNTILIPNNTDFDFFAALRSYLKFSILVLLFVGVLLAFFWNWQPWFEIEIKSVNKSTEAKTALQSDMPFIIHIVQPGETASAIAQRYGVGLSVLLKYNDIDNPNLLRSGQSLKILRQRE